jgi:selenocysteine-specific translation elongation factor
MRVVATAGHVDHGKSSLVLALTGTDPDRWEEEKRRGLTIDLGFAHTELPSGDEVAFVDVPGHVRFLRNMLAGVAASMPASSSSPRPRDGSRSRRSICGSSTCSASPAGSSR